MAVAGYIKLSKKILGWAWYDNINVFKIFIHLLLTAEYQERKIGRLTLERGQAFISQREVAKINGLSYKQVRNALECLQDTGEIEMHTTSKGTVITIRNYTKYQDFVVYQGRTRGAQGAHKTAHKTAQRTAQRTAQDFCDYSAENTDSRARERAHKTAHKTAQVKILKKPKTAKKGRTYIIYKKIKKEKKKKTLSGVCPAGRIEKRSDDFIPGYDF